MRPRAPSQTALLRVQMLVVCTRLPDEYCILKYCRAKWNRNQGAITPFGCNKKVMVSDGHDFKSH